MKMIMKKLFVAMLLVLAMALPAMAQSESWVSGSASQSNGAAINPYPGTGAGGGQSGSAGFSALQSAPSGESAWGNACLNGGTIVSAFVNPGDTMAGAFGNTWNNGTVNAGVSPGGPVNTYLNGSGSMQTGTYASIGGFGNGAFAETSTNGAFGYSASGGAGWTGNGYTSGYGFSVVNGGLYGLSGSFSAFSKAGVSSFACPK